MGIMWFRSSAVAPGRSIPSVYFGIVGLLHLVAGNAKEPEIFKGVGPLDAARENMGRSYCRYVVRAGSAQLTNEGPFPGIQSQRPGLCPQHGGPWRYLTNLNKPAGFPCNN